MKRNVAPSLLLLLVLAGCGVDEPDHATETVEGDGGSAFRTRSADLQSAQVVITQLAGSIILDQFALERSGVLPVLVGHELRHTHTPEKRTKIPGSIILPAQA